MTAGHLALVIAALFTGAAFYITACEHPARLALEDRALLTEWKPSYKRGFAMQAPLALIGSIFGFWAWMDDGGWLWLTGAIMLISAWPYTLLLIRPTNNELMGTEPADAGPRSRMLVEKWGRLHAGRTGLGIVSTILFLWASLAAPN